jgi:signal transduction histidine kinase
LRTSRWQPDDSGHRPASRDRALDRFEKFGRGYIAGSPGTPGTGLGLYIARSIVEAHGGALEVSSGPDAGATFTLSLPVDSAR